MITSRENQKLKDARKVRDGKVDGSIFVEGVRLAEEVIRSGTIIREGLIAESFAGDRATTILELLLEKGVVAQSVSDPVFRSVADTGQPQGIVLICERPENSKASFESRLSEDPAAMQLIVFLHQINNPSNLGAIMRTAEAAGVAGLVCSVNSADPFSPKALRASMGSAFRLPIWHGGDMDEVCDWAVKRGMKLTAADTSGYKSYTEIDWKFPRLLVFGSEAHGLSEHDKARINDLIAIPMNSSVESLNLAVAAGVILFEARRQVFG